MIISLSLIAALTPSQTPQTVRKTYQIPAVSCKGNDSPFPGHASPAYGNVAGIYRLGNYRSQPVFVACPIPLVSERATAPIASRSR